MGNSTFRFSGFDTNEKAEKLLEILNSLKLISEDMVDRFDQAKDHLVFANVNYKDPIRRVPMKYFAYAITEYVLGFFEASVFYSSLSVELMLFRSAIAKLGKQKLIEVMEDRKGPLSFYWLIHTAHILKGEDVKVADEIRKMRDCYVHFQNQLLYSEMGKLPGLERFPEVPDEEKEKILEIDKMFRKEFDKVFPSHEELVWKPHLDFIKKRRKIMEGRAMEELSKVHHAGILPSMGAVDLAMKVEALNVLDALNWSRRLLENPEYHIP